MSSRKTVTESGTAPTLLASVLAKGYPFDHGLRSWAKGNVPS